jgi:hypothetical protein
MDHKRQNLSSLPLNALQEIPSSGPDAQNIVALVRKGGRVSGYKLSDGRILSREEGVALAREGGIQGVGIATNQGTLYLKSLPDDREENNLGNLPSVTDKQ